MSRHLAIDWDHQSLRVVAATLRAGELRIEKAAGWQEEQNPNIAEAEELGHHLRERLQSAGIAPAPVLACVARDRVILREVRYPAVAAGEEPAVIRFQVMKELNDSPDDVIIDYTTLGETAPGEERRALVLTVRRELLAAYQMLCKAAGLKLLALTPRPFGALACLRESKRKWQGSGALAEPLAGDSRQAAVALLTAADGWAEFCLVCNDALLVARSLPAGSALAAEVRRNIAVYTAQSPRHTVSALYLAGNGESAPLQESLQNALDIPVRTFDPFVDAEVADLPAQNRGAFAGAVGLLRTQANWPPLPINFVFPKKPQAARDPNKRSLAWAAGLAACLLIGLVSYCYSQLAALDRDLEAKRAEKLSLEKGIPELKKQEDQLLAYDVWRRGDIPWLDEIYNLTVLMPDHSKMLLTELAGDAQTVTKDKHSAKLTMKGGTNTDEEVTRFIYRFRQDKHYVPRTPVPGHRPQKDFPSFAKQFTEDVDVEWQPPEKYKSRLQASVVRIAPRERPIMPRQTQQIAAYQPLPVRGGLKIIAPWVHGTPHVQEVASPPVRPYTAGRNFPQRRFPPANSSPGPGAPSNVRERMQELMDLRMQNLQNWQSLPAVEKALPTQEKPRMLAPKSAAAPAPAASAPKDKGKKK